MVHHGNPLSGSFEGATVRAILVAVLLLVTYTFGGRSNNFNLHVFVTATALIAIAWMFVDAGKYGRRPLDPWLLAIGLIPLFLHLVQLVPLPPSIWHSLPGRELEKNALALVGMQDDWMPFTMAPYSTQIAIGQIVPGLLILYMTLRLSNMERRFLMMIVVLLGLLSIFVGVFQLSGGDANWMRFYSYNDGQPWLTGFNENRNTTAELLNYSALAAVFFLFQIRDRMSSRSYSALLLASVMIFAIAVVLTGSRSGMVACLIPIAAAAILIAMRNFNRRALMVGAGALVVVAVLALALFSNPRIQNSWSRFESVSDVTRAHIHEDTHYAVKQYWPAGAGMDSFQTVFPVAERLEYVQGKYANRAHNDYLELVLEAGVAGIIALAIIVIILIARLALNFRMRPNRETLSFSFFAVCALIILGLHSLVDYPLRTVAVSSILAFAVGALGQRPIKAVGGTNAKE